MIVGTGIDIVETRRIRALVDKYGDRFTRRWFGATEIAYCESTIKPYLHYAARMSAKEAAFKALRLEHDRALCWKDIIIERQPDGAPDLRLGGLPLERARQLGVQRLHLSISLCASYSVAMVTAEGTGGG